MRDGFDGRSVQVVIEKPAVPEVRDAFGDVVETWQEHATRWAFIEPLQGSELFQAQQMQAVADRRIWMRYDATTAQITPVMRVRHGTRIFDIRSIINTASQNAELQVLALERIAA